MGRREGEALAAPYFVLRRATPYSRTFQLPVCQALHMFRSRVLEVEVKSDDLFFVACDKV